MTLGSGPLRLSEGLRVDGPSVAMAISCTTFSDEVLSALPPDVVSICCDETVEGYRIILLIEELLMNNDLDLIIALDRGCASCVSIVGYVREALLRTGSSTRLEQRTVGDATCAVD